VDLYLIHWPNGFFEENKVPVHVLWPKLEALVEKGFTKSIGLSNFGVSMIMDLLCYCKLKPVCNQVELNPMNVQDDLVRFMKSVDIVPVAFTPICRPGTERSNDFLASDVLKKL